MEDESTGQSAKKKKSPDNLNNKSEDKIEDGNEVSDMI